MEHEMEAGIMQGLAGFGSTCKGVSETERLCTLLAGAQAGIHESPPRNEARAPLRGGRLGTEFRWGWVGSTTPITGKKGKESLITKWKLTL